MSQSSPSCFHTGVRVLQKNREALFGTGKGGDRGKEADRWWWRSKERQSGPGKKIPGREHKKIVPKYSMDYGKQTNI